MEEVRCYSTEERQKEYGFFTTPHMPFEEQLKPYWSPQLGHPAYVAGGHSPDVCKPKLKNLKPLGQFSHPCQSDLFSLHLQRSLESIVTSAES